MYYIPNNLLSAIEYAKRCDFSFMRTDVDPFLPNDKFSDITSGSSVYCWSNHLNSLFEYLEKSEIKDITLVSGDNDHASNPNGILISWPQHRYDGVIPVPKSISRWFAQNAEIHNDVMCPIPIGLGKGCKSESIRKMLIDCNRDKLMYCNFDFSTNPIQRSWISKIVKKYCPEATHQYEKVNAESFYRALQEHKFVLCPPGNGKDTHRAWESLYFGSFPVVEDSVMNRYFSKLFPFVVVNRWCDITSTFLLDKYEELSSRTWDYNLLDPNYLMKWYNINKNHR